MQLRDILKTLKQQFPKPTKLHADRVAAVGAVETAYLGYSKFSLDSIHCSITALGRHLKSEEVQGTKELTVSVVPYTTENDILDTILHACRALMGLTVGANELIGPTPTSAKISQLVEEYERNGWQQG